MGGKKGGLKALAKGIGKDLVARSTAGLVDIEKKKVGFDPEAAGESYLASTAYSGTMEGAMGGPVAPPAAVEDPAEQAARAKAEAEANLMKEINLKNTGLGLTNLGGSVVSDGSNLKKKKLLGE